MHPFHTALLYEKMPPVDRIAWILASVTVPAPLHRHDDPLAYRREHKKLWDIECYRRAVKIRAALDDMIARVSG